MSTIVTKNNLVMVVYDRVSNSVFASQVLAPLARLRAQEQYNQILVVSFEKDLLAAQRVVDKLPQHEGISIVLLKRPWLPGWWGLKVAARALSKLLCGMQKPFELKARGPLAGYVALCARNRMRGIAMPELTIQVRGLCTQEARFVWEHAEHKTVFMRLRFVMQHRFLHALETYLFSLRAAREWGSYHLEVVSRAMQTYLTQSFRTPPTAMSLAQHDAYEPLSATQRQQWRAAVRKQLNIPEAAIVYCYSGSYKAWQCAQQTVARAAQLLHQDPHAYFVALTTDVALFEQEVAVQKLPPGRVRVLRVAPQELMPYLAAADVGFLFRTSDLVNWTSRPTKMLEYQAAGLRIEHNNTVAALVE